MLNIFILCVSCSLINGSCSGNKEGTHRSNGTGSISSASESQVFEIIHLDEDKEKVSNKDKIITGKLFFQMCSSGEWKTLSQEMFKVVI